MVLSVNDYEIIISGGNQEGKNKNDILHFDSRDVNSLTKIAEASFYFNNTGNN